MSISQPPLSNYGILTGQLFLYGAGRAAFESSSSPKPPQSPLTVEETEETESYYYSSQKKCILLGGLSDGLCPVPYTQDLEDACRKNSWSLVQPILSSSYTGFGHGSLKRDCVELEELMKYLIEYRNAQEFCLVGHSTGCQNAVHFLEAATDDSLTSRLKVIGLQAPVSDREATMVHPPENYSQLMADAKALVLNGKGQEMMPRSAFWAPITAQRFLDLNERGGADDYFSSDYTDKELAERLEHVGKYNDDLKVLVAFSGSDEYVPSHVDKRQLTQRLVAAMNTHCCNDDGDGDKKADVAQGLYIESGNHNLSQGPEDGKVFVDKLAELLKA